MRIVFSGTRVIGDNSPDTPTRVFTVQTLKCMNRNCPHQDEKTIEHELKIDSGPDNDR